MADLESENAASGVQDLIHRIRDDGVRAGKEEAARIVREAEREAAATIAKARAEAERTLEEARSRIASERHAAEESLKLAARDTIEELGTGVRAGFERQLKRLVSAELEDKDFLRRLILAVTQQTAEESVKDKAVTILLSERGNSGKAAGEEDEASEERIRNFILSLSGESLREGIEFKTDPGVETGVSVRIEGEDLRIDLNDETITDYLVQNLHPRYRRILLGQD